MDVLTERRQSSLLQQIFHRSRCQNSDIAKRHSYFNHKSIGDTTPQLISNASFRFPEIRHLTKIERNETYLNSKASPDQRAAGHWEWLRRRGRGERWRRAAPPSTSGRPPRLSSRAPRRRRRLFSTGTRRRERRRRACARGARSRGRRGRRESVEAKRATRGWAAPEEEGEETGTE